MQNAKQKNQSKSDNQWRKELLGAVVSCSPIADGIKSSRLSYSQKCMQVCPE